MEQIQEYNILINNIYLKYVNYKSSKSNKTMYEKKMLFNSLNEDIEKAYAILSKIEHDFLLNNNPIASSSDSESVKKNINEISGLVNSNLLGINELTESITDLNQIKRDNILPTKIVNNMQSDINVKNR